jgi:hypothetical protein
VSELVVGRITDLGPSSKPTILDGPVCVSCRTIIMIVNNKRSFVVTPQGITCYQCFHAAKPPIDEKKP